MSFDETIYGQANVILALGPQTDHSSRNSSPNSSINTVPEKTKWSCHKDILKSCSNYFNSILNNQFQEAETSIVFLPIGIFTSFVLDDILYFMYQKTLPQQPINRPDTLDHLLSMYMAADYLSMENLCSRIHQEILHLTHGLVCYCESCTLYIPQLLAFTGPNQYPSLSTITHSILKLIISDPERTLPTYWSSPALASLFIQSPEMEKLHAYLQDGLLQHVNKNNAIETLHGCFLATKATATPLDRTVDDDWSPLIITQNRMQQTGSKLLADHFDFYCTKYPKLLSCVDGITYSSNFLDYLFTSMLNHMNEMNACLLYKGIVKSLISRDSVQRTPEVKLILQNAKVKTVRYIGGHLTVIKELKAIDQSIVEQLAQDLVVPLNTLLDDDSKRMIKPGNNAPKQYSIEKKQPPTPWNIKLRSRICTIVFGQATLNFKIGQRIRLLTRPIPTFGTILYVGKLPSIVSEEKPMTSRKKLVSVVNEYYLGVELDRSVGSNDGTFEGTRYFNTLPNRGLFVKPTEVTLV